MKTAGLKVFYKDVPKWTKEDILKYLNFMFNLSKDKKGLVETNRKIIEDKKSISLIVECK